MGVIRDRFGEGVPVAAVLLLAAVLRMGWPGMTEFKGDEARLVALALEMAQFETFPLRGISSSVGVPNFPASVWLYALPLMVWRHVMAPLLFTGLANALAARLCLVAGPDGNGRPAGLALCASWAEANRWLETRAGSGCRYTSGLGPRFRDLASHAQSAASFQYPRPGQPAPGVLCQSRDK